MEYDNNIEFIFKTDSNGNEIDLNNMPLEVAISIQEIFNSLVEIAKHESDLNLNIGLRRGSVAQSLISDESPKLEVVYNKIKDAADSSSERDNVYVKHLNVIYNRFSQFEDFEVNYKNGDTSESLRPLFVRRFKERRIREKFVSPLAISFFEGVIKDSGGDNPNFHLRLDSGAEVKIKCTSSQAKDMARMLYERINISTWSKQKSDEKNEYTFCDRYLGDSIRYYEELIPFYHELIVANEVDSFNVIKEKLEFYFNDLNMAGAKKLIRLFLNENSTPTYLRTILILSKAFKDDEDMNEMLEAVKDLLTQKIGKVY